MAGGEGTRLRPLTSNQPKPMIPLANRPIMEHVVDLLKQHGFDDIIVTVAFRANAIRTYFGNGAEFGVRMVYATEETPLGTAGSVRNAMEQLDEPFLVISGDVLTDIDLGAVVEFHERKKAMATIGLKSMENPLEFGIVITAPDGSVERFLEKPSWGEVFSDTINTGVYVLDPEIFGWIPPDVAVDFSGEVFPELLANEKPVYGYVADGYWEDIGTLEAYVRAHQDILDGRVAAAVPGFRLGEGVWMGEGCEVDPGATIKGPAILGDYCRVEAGTVLGEYTVLGSNVRVGADAFLERSVVHDNGYLGPAVRLRGAVVGRSSDLRRGARLEEGVVLGDECFVGDHAVINPGVKVFPSKTVEHGAVVNSSIVWESRGARTLFGRLGVSGLANVDISPELAVRLAMAYGTTMPKGSLVVASRDTSRAARVLKRAVMVGLNAAGIDVADLEVATVPVTRFGVRDERALGGVTVRLAHDDPQWVVIRFFDHDGIDLSEGDQRKIERLFYREDFRRSLAAEIGDLSFPARTAESYTQVLMEGINVDAVRAARFKLVLDYAYGAPSFVMPNVLAKLGAEVLSVNPYASTRQSLTFDRVRQAERVSELVRASGAHLGAVMDTGGEHLTLVDDGGHVLSDSEGLMALLRLVLGPPAATAPGTSAATDGSRRKTVALPVSVGRGAETMVEDAGAALVWTKLSASHLLEVAAEPGVDFAGSLDGEYVFPSFLPAFDAVAAFVQTLSLLAQWALSVPGSAARLSRIVAALPAVRVAHESVVTPWEQKGSVMRMMMERCAPDHELLLVDGVKVLHDDGWALVLPHPEEPVTDIWAEGVTATEARARAQEYARHIRNLLRA
jgi:mannose-1-phosphate guanylyltransferase / phosphomannomutase